MTPFDGHLDDAQAQRLVDDALVDAEAAQVRAHARSCADCRALVDSYRALDDALSGLELPPLPADFTEGVLSRIDANERALARERRLAVGILVGVLAAAVAVFAAAGAAAWAPAVARASRGLGDVLLASRVVSGAVPTLVSALRLELLLAVALLAVPLLLALSRLIPAPRPETAS
jgi:anti-sigma factor RsiW